MPSHDPHGHDPAADTTIRALDTPLGPTTLLDRPERRNALTLPMWQALGARVLELAAEALRQAHDLLGEITGRVSPDELLGHIFATFCIGK